MAKRPLRTVQLPSSSLFRISRHSSGEPHFGRSASNRFDDPRRDLAKRFGTCYLGESLEVAVAETILHDEMPVAGRFELAAPLSSSTERRTSWELLPTSRCPTWMGRSPPSSTSEFASSSQVDSALATPSAFHASLSQPPASPCFYNHFQFAEFHTLL